MNLDLILLLFRILITLVALAFYHQMTHYEGY